MRIETRNFCWSMDSDDVEEGFVIPFRPGVHQGMDGVIIETKCVPESAFYRLPLKERGKEKKERHTTDVICLQGNHSDQRRRALWKGSYSVCRRWQ